MNLINKMNHIKPSLHKALLIFVVLYFLTFGILMTHSAGQPDQGPHGYYSRRYSETWGLPKENTSSQFIVTGQPFLYYWINGAVYKIYNLLFSDNKPISDVLLWRLISVLISTGTVIYTYKLSKKITGNPYAGVLAAFFLANTMMFVFVSGGISYDNLINFASVASIYHLVRVYKREDFVKHTLLTGIWAVVGGLSKEMFLLLDLIIFLAWAYFVIRNFRSIKLHFDTKKIILLVIFIIGIALFAWLYGKNFINYGSTTPSCGQVNKPEVCGGYSYRWENYNPFNISWMWYDRDRYLMNPFDYAFSYWLLAMVRSVWGILSHNTFVPFFTTALQGLLTIWAFICLVRYWRPKEKDITLIVLILLSYITYIFFWNYQTEVEFSFQHYGVTGRYLLPIIGVLVSLISYVFFKIKSIILRRLTISTAIMVYFASGLGMFISRYANVFIHWRIY